MTTTNESAGLNIALAQINFLVGNIATNIDNIVQSATYARDELKADLIVFPELIVTGYPAEDLLLRKDFIEAANNAIHELAERVNGIALVVGFPNWLTASYTTAPSYYVTALPWLATVNRLYPITACLTSAAISLLVRSPACLNSKAFLSA